MRSVEAEGKTVDEAIECGLRKLGGRKREEVNVEVLEEGSRGFLGFLGGRVARVRLTVKADAETEAGKLVEDILNAMRVSAQLEVRRKEDTVYVVVKGKDAGVLIGKRGETLDALQYLVGVAVNRKLGRRVRIVLDVEGYRRRREQTLTRLAQRLSEKVKRTGVDVVLEPMSPQERRVIHAALQNDSEVYTFSRGEDPYRKVVISLRNRE